MKADFPFKLNRGGGKRKIGRGVMVIFRLSLK